MPGFAGMDASIILHLVLGQRSDRKEIFSKRAGVEARVSILKVKEIGHCHQNNNIDDCQQPSDFHVIPGLIFSGAHVERIHLMGRQDERVGDPKPYDNGRHARVDADLVCDGNALFQFCGWK